MAGTGAYELMTRQLDQLIATNEWCICSHSYKDHCADDGSYMGLCVHHSFEGCHCHSFKPYQKGLTYETVDREIVSPVNLEDLEPAF